MRWFRRLTACVILLAVLASSAIGAPPDQARYLNVPRVYQRTYSDKWCWAAAGVSILQYFGINDVTLCMFVSKAKTGSTNPLICDVSWEGTDQDIRYSLSYFGVASSHYSGALPFSTVRSEINNNRPIHAHLRLLNSNNKDVGGHSVIIDGYYYDPYLGVQDVRYMDPWYGSYVTWDYSEFVRQDGVRYWKQGLWKFW